MVCSTPVAMAMTNLQKCGQAGLEKKRRCGRKKLNKTRGIVPMVNMRWSS